MKKLKAFLSILVFILIPTVTFASSSDGTESFPVGVAIFMEAFVSIHMSIFVLFPLSKMLSKGDSKKLFLTLFIIRAIILLFCSIYWSIYYCTNCSANY